MKILYQSELKLEQSSPESSPAVNTTDDSENISPCDGSLSPRVTDASKSCLKPNNSVEKSAKRPILCVVKDERFNHIQRHLHPLAYICD